MIVLVNYGPYHAWPERLCEQHALSCSPNARRRYTACLHARPPADYRREAAAPRLPPCHITPHAYERASLGVAGLCWQAGIGGRVAMADAAAEEVAKLKVAAAVRCANCGCPCAVFMTHSPVPQADGATTGANEDNDPVKKAKREEKASAHRAPAAQSDALR